ncbi:MAG: hypothetical protein M5R36_12805 [Deltaproteobacteria bacterium]|nr:hypothetical protein [Deltaproteobacteria bacterium]
MLDRLVWETTRTLVATLDADLRFRRVSRGLADLFGAEGGLVGRGLL